MTRSPFQRNGEPPPDLDEPGLSLFLFLDDLWEQAEAQRSGYVGDPVAMAVIDAVQDHVTGMAAVLVAAAETSDR